MSAKTTYQATCPTTGETVTRNSAREYTAALAVNVPARPAYTIPAGTYWVTTGKRAHDLNRETGTRGYWNTVSEDHHVKAQDAGVGIASFHADAKAAEKAGRALVNQVAKARQHTADTYGVDYEQGPVTFTVVETTVAGAKADAKADAKAAEKARLAAEVARLEAELAAAKAALAAA